MRRTRSQPNHPTPGFATRLTDHTDLGIALLIADDEAGSCLPIEPVATIAEARQIAQDDFRRRWREVERGGDPLCPSIYRVWARGSGGRYAVAAEFDPSTF